MPGQVGALRVTLGVNSAQYEAGMRQAQATARRTGQDISTSMSTAQARTTTAFAGMTRAAAAWVTSLGVATIAAAGRSILEYADDLDRAAAQAGTNIERFQTLREAFRTLEIPAQSVDRIFRQLVTTLGDVQNGAENEATAALERLGISSRILNGQITTTDQLLDALAESARDAGTAEQFASEMTDIFGQRIGPQLSAALRDGGDALHALEQQMRETGTVIDEEMVQRMAEANETLDRFFEGTKRQAVIWSAELIGAFQDAGAAILDFHNSIGGFTSFGSALTALMGAPGGRAAAMPGQNAGIIGAALTQLNPIGNRRPPRVRTGGGGGGGARRRSGGGGGRSSRATRVEPYDLPISAQGPSIAEMERDLADLNAGVATLDQRLGEIAAIPIPDLGNMLTIEDQDRLEQFAEGFNRDLSAGLAEAIVYGRNLGDVLVNTFQRAAAAALEAGIFDLLTGQGFGGKSGAGGFFNWIGSAVGIATGIGGGSFGPKVKGFAAGGSFTVGGVPGVDRNMLSLNGVPVARVSQGETVGVGWGGGGGGGGKVEIVLRDDMLDARIVAGSSVVVTRAAPQIAADGAGKALREISRTRLGR